MNNNLKLIFIIICACLIAQVSYMMAERGVRRFNVNGIGKRTEILEHDTYYDILYLGSSRTEVHLNPCIIDSIIGLKSYNAGTAGGNSTEAKMLLEAYLVHHKPPKYVFYNIDMRSVNNVGNVPNNILYFFYLDNERVKNVLNQSGFKTDIYQYLPFSRFFRFDDYLRNIALQGNLGKTEILPHHNYCQGHTSNDASIIKKIKMNELEPNKPKNVKDIKDMMNICKKYNIQLVFHSVPNMFNNGKVVNTQSVPSVDSLIYAEKQIYLRLDTVTNFPQKYFFDMVHLNRKGSELYSVLFAQKIKEIIFMKN